jgi:hypothetical protein
MMKKNTPNVRSSNPDYGSFEDGLADLRGILNRSAAAAEPHNDPQDDADQEVDDCYQDDNQRRPQERFYPREENDRRPQQRFYPQGEDDRYPAQRGQQPGQERGFGMQETGPLYPTSGAYGYDEEAEPYEYDSQSLGYDSWPLRRRSSVSLRILLGVVAAAAVAVLFALFTSDATRAIIANAKEAILPERQDRTVASEPVETQLTAGDLQLKDPARFGLQSIQPVTGRRPGSSATASATALASRDDVATTYSASPSPYQGNGAYQGAPQSRSLLAPPAAAPSNPPASIGSFGTTPARRLAADELATLMRRARSLLAAGDIPSARLLLERAADAQDSSAAFMLAQTYDPVVLGTQDARRVVPDPATARAWYERAAQLGSIEAQRRLGQLTN